MPQFDVYRTAGGLVLDVQSDLLDGLASRVVVPLVPVERAPKPARRLNPVFDLGERPHVMVMQFMAAVPCVELTQRVGSLAVARDVIKPALDMVFDGV